MPMSFIMSKNVEHSWEKTPRELLERFTNHLIIIIIIIIIIVIIIVIIIIIM